MNGEIGEKHLKTFLEIDLPKYWEVGKRGIHKTEENVYEVSFIYTRGDDSKRKDLPR